jgi:hypothetical protein
MRIRTAKQVVGPIPSEKIATIRTTSSTEEVIVHVSQIDPKGIEVGLITQRGNEFLVELPRESLAGHWRVWVPKSAVD